MKPRKTLSRHSRIVLFFDVIAVLAGFALAWLIRSQFRWFVFRPVDAVVLCPWIILLRIVTNTFFDHYGVGLPGLTVGDLGRLLWTSLIPSAILMSFRYVFAINYFRMPLSMILLEYVFSMVGFVFIRVVAQRSLIKRDDVPIFHRQRVLLVGEIQELDDDRVIEELEKDGKTIVRGILTDNPMHWDESLRERRICGPIERARALVAADDSISALVVHGSAKMSQNRVEAMRSIVRTLNLELGYWRGQRVKWENQNDRHPK